MTRRRSPRRPGPVPSGRAVLGCSVAVVLLVTGTGCSSPSTAPQTVSSTPSTTPANVYEQQRADGVTAVLRSLTAALTNGDRAALDALIDPLATAAFRESLYRAQDDLSPNRAPTVTRPPAVTESSGTPSRSAVSSSSPTRPRPAPSRGSTLKLRTFDYSLAANSAERLIGGALGVRLTEQDSSDNWVSNVTVSYALGGTVTPGVDEPVINVPTVLAFARYGDEWKLLGDGSLAPDAQAAPDSAGRPPEVVPWAFGGLAAVDVASAGGVSSILSYPGTETTVAKVRRQLAPAIDTVADFWGDRWARRAVVMATADATQFAGFTRTREGETSAAAAATVYSRLDRGAGTVVGQRIVLSPTVSQLSEAGIGVVLRHELTHVATRLDTAESAPMWLTEGVAEYVGRLGTKVDFTDVAPELAAQVAGGQVPADLPADADFAVDVDAARVAYQTAWSFAAFVADIYGEERLKQMYLALARGGDDSTMNAETMNGDLQKIFGADKTALIRQWRAWLPKEVR